MYSAPDGFTQDTPGISLSSSHALSRWAISRPPGSTRSLMLWWPPSAVCTAYCVGTLGHSRMLARMSRPSM